MPPSQRGSGTGTTTTWSVPSRTREPRSHPSTTSSSSSPTPTSRPSAAITTIDDDDLGPLRMQNIMFRLLDTPGGIRFSGRRLGQDTDHVYAQLLGLEADKLDQLRNDGVL